LTETYGSDPKIWKQKELLSKLCT